MQEYPLFFIMCNLHLRSKRDVYEDTVFPSKVREAKGAEDAYTYIICIYVYCIYSAIQESGYKAGPRHA